MLTSEESSKAWMPPCERRLSKMPDNSTVEVTISRFWTAVLAVAFKLRLWRVALFAWPRCTKVVGSKC